jgi:hypothetical protein
MQLLQAIVIFSFVGLLIGKLGDVGNLGSWSWWWVTCPLWGSALLYYGGSLLCGIVCGMVKTDKK